MNPDTMPETSGLDRVLPWLRGGVLLLLITMAFGVFAPGMPDWDERFIGAHYVDAYGTQWFYWYISHVLEQGISPGHTDLFFHPWGKDIFGHTGTNVLDAILCLPFRWLLGPVLGYNIFITVCLLLTALAAWALIRDHVEDHFAVGVGVVLFTVAPFQLFELLQGRPTQAILLFPVLFVRHMIRTGQRRSWTDPVIAGLALAVSGYQYWYYALFGGLGCLGWGLCAAFRSSEQAGRSVQVLLRYALVAAVALFAVSPVAVPLMMSASSGEVPGLLNTELWSATANPPITEEGMTIGLFLWQPLHRFSGFYVVDPDGTERFLAQNVLVPMVGMAALLLALRDRAGLPRLALAGSLVPFMLLATGPMLFLGSIIVPNLPYIFLTDHLDVMRRLWWPARASAFLIIFVGVAIAQLVARAGRRHPLLGLATALCVAGFWFADLKASRAYPLKTWSAEVPAGYKCLAHGDEGAIIELPYNWNQLHLYYQTIHHRPILGGMLENNPVFTPDELGTLLNENEYVASLLEMSKLHLKEFDPDPTDAK